MDENFGFVVDADSEGADNVFYEPIEVSDQDGIAHVHDFPEPRDLVSRLEEAIAARDLSIRTIANRQALGLHDSVTENWERLLIGEEVRVSRVRLELRRLAAKFFGTSN